MAATPGDLTYRLRTTVGNHASVQWARRCRNPKGRTAAEFPVAGASAAVAVARAVCH
ncbi:MAG: hypothetical protein ACRECX_07810 [Methyloceanibacter sp.]